MINAYKRKHFTPDDYNLYNLKPSYLSYKYDPLMIKTHTSWAFISSTLTPEYYWAFISTICIT